MIKKDFDYLTRKAEVLKALSHPIRLSIIRDLIENGPKKVSDLNTGKEVPLPTVSQHLTKLRYAGLVKQKRKGVEIYYSLKNDDLVTELVQAYL
jgi:DNA-binding transcriptional ArsR family regulator